MAGAPLISAAVARNAMATRFEILLYGESEPALRAAGEEALAEIERLDQQLSLYRPTSELAHLNARAAREPVRVEPGLFELLRVAQRVSQQTGGAFDITVAPLMRCWRLMRGSPAFEGGREPMGGQGKVPSEEELAQARECVGMQWVELDADNFTVRFARPGVQLDLGAIGKGWAIDRAVEILRDAGIQSALIHGGTSTIYGLGTPPGEEAWAVGIDRPRNEHDREPVAGVHLRDAALSVSAVWGKSFQSGLHTYGHVLDPRLGRPVQGASMAAVALASAVLTDAFSTALLVLGTAGENLIRQIDPSARCWCW